MANPDIHMTEARSNSRASCIYFAVFVVLAAVITLPLIFHTAYRVSFLTRLYSLSNESGRVQILKVLEQDKSEIGDFLLRERMSSIGDQPSHNKVREMLDTLSQADFDKGLIALLDCPGPIRYKQFEDFDYDFDSGAKKILQRFESFSGTRRREAYALFSTGFSGFPNWFFDDLSVADVNKLETYVEQELKSLQSMQGPLDYSALLALAVQYGLEKEDNENVLFANSLIYEAFEPEWKRDSQSPHRSSTSVLAPLLLTLNSEFVNFEGIFSTAEFWRHFRTLDSGQRYGLCNVLLHNSSSFRQVSRVLSQFSKNSSSANQVDLENEAFEDVCDFISTMGTVIPRELKQRWLKELQQIDIRHPELLALREALRDENCAHKAQVQEVLSRLESRAKSDMSTVQLRAGLSTLGHWSAANLKQLRDGLDKLDADANLTFEVRQRIRRTLVSYRSSQRFFEYSSCWESPREGLYTTLWLAMIRDFTDTTESKLLADELCQSLNSWCREAPSASLETVLNKSLDSSINTAIFKKLPGFRGCLSKSWQQATLLQQQRVQQHKAFLESYRCNGFKHPQILDAISHYSAFCDSRVEDSNSDSKAAGFSRFDEVKELLVGQKYSGQGEEDLLFRGGVIDWLLKHDWDWLCDFLDGYLPVRTKSPKVKLSEESKFSDWKVNSAVRELCANIPNSSKSLERLLRLVKRRPYFLPWLTELKTHRSAAIKALASWKFKGADDVIRRGAYFDMTGVLEDGKVPASDTTPWLFDYFLIYDFRDSNRLSRQPMTEDYLLSLNPKNSSQLFELQYFDKTNFCAFPEYRDKIYKLICSKDWSDSFIFTEVFEFHGSPSFVHELLEVIDTRQTMRQKTFGLKYLARLSFTAKDAISVLCQWIEDCKDPAQFEYFAALLNALVNIDLKGESSIPALQKVILDSQRSYLFRSMAICSLRRYYAVTNIKTTLNELRAKLPVAYHVQIDRSTDYIEWRRGYLQLGD